MRSTTLKLWGRHIKRCGIAAFCAVVSVGLLSFLVGPAMALSVEAAAAFGNPEVPSGWAESSLPCDVSEGAILPQSAPWHQVGEPVMAPAAYFTYGEPFPLEALPASDFAATFSWGDGTSSPALVEGANGERGCYTVSVPPSHVYASVGTYALSYTIVELKPDRVTSSRPSTTRNFTSGPRLHS